MELRARAFSLSLLALLLLPVADGQRMAGTKPRPGAREEVPFEIVSCSLGCTAGSAGFVCTETEIHRNEEIRVTFSKPVAPSSISVNTFRLIDVGNGSTPPATFTLDPLDPSTLIFRPQMTFDSAGNPVFGLVDGHVYMLFLPGVAQGDSGPFLTAVDGEPNRTRLQCTLTASLGLADFAPGRPRAKLSVLVVTARDPVTGEPIAFARVPADGAVDVWLGSPIDLVFADVMNPATLANPVTGSSSTVRVFFDPDGNPQTTSDQVPIAGTFGIAIDQTRPSTLVRFQAERGLPVSGTTRPPGRVVVELSPVIQDIAGNAIANAGRAAFTTESM